MLEESWMGGRNNGEELVSAGSKGKGSRYQLYIIDTKNKNYHFLTYDSAAKLWGSIFFV